MIYWTLLTLGDKVPILHLQILSAETSVRLLYQHVRKSTTFTNTSSSQDRAWHCQHQGQPRRLQHCRQTPHPAPAPRKPFLTSTLCTRKATVRWKLSRILQLLHLLFLTALLHCFSDADGNCCCSTWLTWAKLFFFPPFFLIEAAHKESMQGAVIAAL